MNSIGVNPYVNNLYRDLCNGLVLLQVIIYYNFILLPCDDKFTCNRHLSAVALTHLCAYLKPVGKPHPLF